MLTLHVTDQGVNARVCEKKEVGIEVPREEEDEAFLRGDLAETVRKVMAVKEGRRFRDKAAEEREKVLGNRAIHDWLFSTLLCFHQPHPLGCSTLFGCAFRFWTEECLWLVFL
ncbi:UDP-glycosyltransferase 91B1 [Linum perenne]